MIWIRDGKTGLEKPPRDEMPRATYWLLAQTCIFGILAFVIVDVALKLDPNAWWVMPLLTVALIGFGGGLVGAIAIIAVAHARSLTDSDPAS
jgi:hypothetical protein